MNPKERRIEIKLPETAYPKAMYFNRFRLERDQEFSMAHFGLISPSGLLSDYYCCLFSAQTLDQNRDSLVDYLAKIGEPASRPVAWQGALPVKRVDVVDFISMAFRDKIAETCFAVFSLSAGTQIISRAPAATVSSQPLALMRSTTQLQRLFIVALYEE